MHRVENKDSIIITFTGTLDNGEVFMEINADAPMQVIIGESELPPTVESGIMGMTRGQTRKIRVPPEEGYGPRLKELVHEVPLKSFGEKIIPKPGMILSQKAEKDGIEQRVPATVIEVKENSVVIDYNHPLAGHDLTYSLTVVEIIKPN